MSAAPPRTLVLGWGNDLRGDDGAGPAVVDQLADELPPHVRTYTAVQLTPELAQDLSVVDEVVFVDASAAAVGQPVTARPVRPATAGDPGTTGLGHHLDPAVLLAFTAALYGRAPAAWLVAVPAQQFDVGVPFSAVTTAGIAAAVAVIRTQVGSPLAVSA